MNTISFFEKFVKVSCFIGFIAVIVILASAVYVQIFMDEAPCPLCLLQRAAFVSMAIGLFMNLRYGVHTSNWAIVILSASAGTAVSARQILLHITSPHGFGAAFLGLHMYTWAFIGFAIAVVGSAFNLLVYPRQQLHE